MSSNVTRNKASKYEDGLPHCHNGIAISIDAVSKCYQIYDRPQDRLKQSVFSRMQMFYRSIPTKKYFREFWALKNISFEVNNGETVGIVGRNGSGKSTLLQIVCGTLNPTSGSINNDGRIAALLELGSGFNPEFTGRENVYMNGAVMGMTIAEIDKRFKDIALFADIGDFMEQPIKTYSSGMVVRLAFSVAINADPQILVIDEALSVGDELFQRKCFSRIEEIKRKGATILFVSHSGATVIELCDRAVLLDNGELLASGSPKQIVGKYQKLLYAPEGKRERIRAEIISKNSPIEPGHDLNTPNCTTRKQGGISDTNEAEETYDPHLIPKSTIDYESCGAQIEFPQILSLEGNLVNCLRRGRNYRYSYQVKFNVGATNVRFGMLIKTLSGIELGGATSAHNAQKSIPYISAETKIIVEFRFQCRLNPGTYFMNAGVIGQADTEEKYMHRLLDACMFRVLPSIDNHPTGFVDFSCSPDITIMDEQV